MKSRVVKSSIVLVIIVLFVGASVVSGYQIKTNPQPLGRGWLYVGGTGEGNYTIIQEAIDDANPSDTVFVYHGTYYENVEINKTIDLIGEDRDTTVIDGGWGNYVMYVSSDGVTISGFTIQNGVSGIILVSSSNNNITGNNASNINKTGIVLASSSNNTVMGNTATSNNDIGIYLFVSSNNNTVTGNNASNNYAGIVLDSSSNNNIIMGNTASNNDYGIVLDASSNNNTITGNNASNNLGAGILLGYSSNNNIITGNNVSHNGVGIRLAYSSNNTITGNTINSNTPDGISLYYSNNNAIRNNNFQENQQDAFFNISRGNTWYHNYWNRPRLFPKLIFGTIKLNSKEFPWINIDWRPALKLNDIA